MKRITMYEVAELFAQAYGKCATIEKGVNGFSSTGIYPINPDIFADEDYAPASVTEIEMTQNTVIQPICRTMAKGSK